MTNTIPTTKTCPRCDGTGNWGAYHRVCFKCDGEGTVLTTAALKAANAAYAVTEAARIKADAVASVVAAHARLAAAPRGWVRRSAERALDAAEAYALSVLSEMR